MSDEQDAFDREALALRDKVLKLSSELREHCDSVVILCTISEGADSQLIFDHKGNIYAVRGSVDRFVQMLENRQQKIDEEAEEL